MKSVYIGGRTETQDTPPQNTEQQNVNTNSTTNHIAYSYQINPQENPQAMSSCIYQTSYFPQPPTQPLIQFQPNQAFQPIYQPVQQIENQCLQQPVYNYYHNQWNTQVPYVPLYQPTSFTPQTSPSQLTSYNSCLYGENNENYENNTNYNTEANPENLTFADFNDESLTVLEETVRNSREPDVSLNLATFINL